MLAARAGLVSRTGAGMLVALGLRTKRMAGERRCAGRASSSAVGGAAPAVGGRGAVRRGGVGSG